MHHAAYGTSAPIPCLDQVALSILILIAGDSELASSYKVDIIEAQLF